MSDDLGRYLNDLPYRAEWVIGKDGKLQRLEHSTPMSTKMLENAGRHHVQVRYDGVPLHYYLSSGQSPKAGVVAGRWYPVFGVGTEGWVNKGLSADIANYYGNKGWADVAKWLDARIGDIRNTSDSGNKLTEAKRNELSQNSGVTRTRVTTSDSTWRSSLNRGYSIGVDKPNTEAGRQQYLREIADRATGRWTPTPASAGGGAPPISAALLNQYNQMSAGTRHMFIPKTFE